jgi:hypothetical protein
MQMIMTALVRASFLGQPIPQHQQLAYVLMLLAVNLGTPGGAPAASDSPHMHYNVPAGVLVMLAVALCSALATVYTEWVMNYSCYNSESIHKQNAKMYMAGIVLNGGFFLAHSFTNGEGHALWSPMYAMHWGIVVVLATMGLLVSAIIKYLGSGEVPGAQPAHSCQSMACCIQHCDVYWKQDYNTLLHPQGIHHMLSMELRYCSAASPARMSQLHPDAASTAI